MQEVGSGIYNLARFWLFAGHNQNASGSDLACLLGYLRFTGFVQKNPFSIHTLFTNLCNMVQKSNMKVRNSSTHLVKGRNPYCSWWPTHSQSKLIGSAFFVILQSIFKIYFYTVWSWEMQFLTDKLIVFPMCPGDHIISFPLVLWRPHNSQTFTDPTKFSDFQGLEKLIPFSPNFQSSGAGWKLRWTSWAPHPE